MCALMHVLVYGHIHSNKKLAQRQKIGREKEMRHRNEEMLTIRALPQNAKSTLLTAEGKVGQLVYYMVYYMPSISYVHLTAIGLPLVLH